jgi:hypothetical protein
MYFQTKGKEGGYVPHPGGRPVPDVPGKVHKRKDTDKSKSKCGQWGEQEGASIISKANLSGVHPRHFCKHCFKPTDPELRDHPIASKELRTVVMFKQRLAAVRRQAVESKGSAMDGHP